MAEAVRRARAGSGTHLVEVTSDADATGDVVEAVARRLDALGAFDEKALRDWRAEAITEADEAFARAMADPPAREAHALSGVPA